ncbi:MAG: site-specific integrase [Desulfobacteraceae bacterium]|nr:site-specific integrase [Desulfobacteraceae bacterium]
MGFYKDPKRKDWIYRFQYLGKNYGGRGFKTKKEAMAAREARKIELRHQQPEATGMAFSEACDTYLDFAKRRFVVGVYKHKKFVYKCFFEFLGGDIPLIDVTTEMVSKYLATRHSNNNYNVHRKQLSAFFTYAEDILEIIPKNPCKKIILLPHTPKEKQIPKESDIIKLILAADPNTDEKNLIIVLLHTLARIDEALRLKWEDINFEKKTLTKWTRKTKDGSYKKIMVSINSELYATLWNMWQNRKQDTRLFYNERTENRYIHRPKFMRGLCKRAGIKPHFGFHTLRHLMASFMADNPKTSTKTIQKILGHSSFKTTEIYLHELDGAVEKAMDDLSGKFTIKKDGKNAKATP